MIRKLIPLLFVFALLCSVASPDVKGQFKADKTIIAPKFVCAYPSRSQFDAHQMQVEVVLSEGQVDPKAAVAALDPHTQMINQGSLMESNYILIFVDPSGKVGMNATLSKTMTQFIDSTEMGLKAELTTNTPERLAGHIYNPKPVTTQGGVTYQADLTFDTAITRAPAGAKLPAGGGEPGKALAALYTAMAKKDLEGIRKYVTKETMSRMEEDYNTPEENLASVLDTLGIWMSKKAGKVVGGEMQGDSAVLEVESEIYEGTGALYLVRMVKAASGWMMSEARMVGML